MTLTITRTPGPWAVGVYDTTETFRSIAQHACVCDPGTMALIAVTGPADDKQSQLDADLIAAAPDLLAALQEMDVLAYNMRRYVTIDDDEGFALYNEAGRIMLQAYQAIEKATGRPPQ